MQFLKSLNFSIVKVPMEFLKLWLEFGLPLIPTRLFTSFWRYKWIDSGTTFAVCYDRSYSSLSWFGFGWTTFCLPECWKSRAKSRKEVTVSVCKLYHSLTFNNWIKIRQNNNICLIRCHSLFILFFIQKISINFILPFLLTFLLF